jgi:hypothetical protein
MADRPLFDYDHYENKVRTHNRPLGAVSDFVVKQMPGRLAEIQEGAGDIHSLVHDAELVIAGLRPINLDRFLIDELAWDLAAFDLKLMETGIAQAARLLHSDAKPPTNLITMVNAFAKATDQPPTLTYEELIFINPLQDRRTFTEGRTGLSEADFYEGHRRIESYMDEVLGYFERAIRILSQKGKGEVDEANSVLQNALEKFLAIHYYTDVIGLKMNKDDFNYFREYLKTHPIRETPGASGAFSATIPIYDLLLGGENLAEDRLRDLEEHMRYFPRKRRKDIGKAQAMAHMGLTLNSLYQATSKPETLGSILQELSRQMHVFRGKHYKAVEYQIPDVLTGLDKGTRGETREFLQSRIVTTHIQ